MAKHISPSSFAWKLNQDLFTPLHLAVQQGHTKTALRLVNNVVSGDIVRVKGENGVTPFLSAAELGNIELLLMFLSVCPKSMEDVSIQNETCLHLALKNQHLEAFRVLIGWIELGGEEGPFWVETILNWKIDEDETILDIAALGQDLMEAVSLLANSRVAKHFQDLATAPPHPSKQISIPSAYTHFLRTDKRLNKAAYDGDTDAMYKILKEDQYILDRIDKVAFVDTPLHIAESVGHTRFAKEIFMLKPSFGEKLNQDGLSPMHLAIQNQQFQTALDLARIKKELVSVQGKDGMTPFHYAIKMGNENLVAELLILDPESFGQLTNRNETALHLAVIHDELACLKVLYRWQWLSGMGNMLLTSIDDDSNTPRDIADNRGTNLKICQFLKNKGAPGKNSESNFFPIKMLWYSSTRLLYRPPNNSGEAPCVSYPARKLLRPSFIHILSAYFGNNYWQRAQNGRDVILVACTLIAATTYQAVLSPPGGVWQGDPSLLFAGDSNNNGMILSKVGKTVLPKGLWSIFATLNTVAFAFSVAQIMIVSWNTPCLPFIVALCWIFCYSMALYIISSGSIIPILVSALGFCCLMRMFTEVPPVYRLVNSGVYKYNIIIFTVGVLLYILYALEMF